MTGWRTLMQLGLVAPVAKVAPGANVGQPPAFITAPPMPAPHDAEWLEPYARQRRPRWAPLAEAPSGRQPGSPTNPAACFFPQQPGAKLGPDVVPLEPLPVTHLPTRSGKPGLLKLPAAGQLRPVPRQLPAERNPAERYLYQVMDHLMRANSHIFNGVYAPENFSIWLDNRKTCGAGSDPNTGRLSINPYLLLALPSDAGVASVIAHELGHVVLQTSYAAHPTARQDPLWQARKERWEFLQREKLSIDAPVLQATRRSTMEELEQLFAGPERQRWNQAVARWLADTAPEPAHLAAREAARRELESLVQQLGPQRQEGQRLWKQFLCTEAQLRYRTQCISGAQAARNLMRRREKALISAEAEANWEERYADEAGFEMYIIAGFDDTRYMLGPLKLLTVYLTQHHPGHRALDRTGRGTHDHPTLWWRRQNLADRRRDLEQHPDFKWFFVSPGAIDLFGDQLRQAQDWVRQQLAEPSETG